MSKKNTILLSLLGIVFISLACIFFFWDLDISISLVKENPNFFYVMMAAVGEFPIYIGPVLFGLVYGFTSDYKYLKLASYFVGLIGLYVAFIRLSKGIFEHFLDSNLITIQYVLLSVVSLITYILLFMLFNKVSVKKLYKIRDISLFYLIVSMSSFIFVI